MMARFILVLVYIPVKLDGIRRKATVLIWGMMSTYLLCIDKMLAKLISKQWPVLLNYLNKYIDIINIIKTWEYLSLLFQKIFLCHSNRQNDNEICYILSSLSHCWCGLMCDRLQKSSGVIFNNVLFNFWKVTMCYPSIYCDEWENATLDAFFTARYPFADSGFYMSKENMGY